jgi:hypothetical protein
MKCTLIEQRSVKTVSSSRVREGARPGLLPPTWYHQFCCYYLWISKLIGTTDPYRKATESETMKLEIMKLDFRYEFYPTFLEVDGDKVLPCP